LKKNKSAFRRNVVLLVIAAGIFAAYWIFLRPISLNQEEPYFLKIRHGANLKDVMNSFDTSGIVKDLTSLKIVSTVLGFGDAEVIPGRYKIDPEMNAFFIIKLLKSGRQTPAKVVLNSERMIEDIAGLFSSYLEPDSLAFLNYFTSPEALDSLKTDKQNVITYFIPNTYDIYWTSTPSEVLSRMQKEYALFWQKEGRMEKAAKLSMTPQQIYTLASIVEKESNHKTERPTIAGLYLNRLNIGMRLQADPTVVFANQDFTIHRVWSSHLSIDSPYNTYKYEGLPPGPICMPSINSIDAVLNADKHSYIYMCARPDDTGMHAFAETLQQHAVNANIYRKYLESKGIN